MRLRSHVLIIAAATLLPIIAVVCLAVVLLFQKHRNIELDRLVDTARALSLAVDRDFETGLASLRALATSQDLRTGDLRTFYDESKRVLAGHEVAEAIVLVDPSGQQIINTRRPFGEALPQYGDPDFIKKVVEDGRPAVSNLFIGRIIQRPVISLGVPVILDGQVKYALTLSLSPSSLQQLLAQGAIAADSLASIIDGNKIVVARTRELDKFFAKPAGPVTIANTTENHEGWWFIPRQPNRGVERSYAAHRRSEFSGWTVVLGVPTAKVNAPFWQAFQFIGGGIVVLLGVALGLAAVFGRRITGSIAALAAGAKALGSGESIPIMPSPVFELDEVRRELESALSKRKEMEASVRQSEARLRAIIDTEPECVKVVAPDGKLVEMNAAGLRMLQADSLAAIAGKSLLDFVLPDYHEAFVNLHQKVMCGETATVEFEIVGLKGRQRWLETHDAPLRDAAGQVSALLGVTRDITERKLAEEQLLYELQLIRNITDSADECIFIADENGNVKFANLEAVRTFGFSLDELMGQSLHETLHHSYADGRPFPKSDCVLGRTRVSGSTIRNHEDVFFRKDGSPVIVECSNAPVETDEQRFGAVLIARDITERKRAEEALRAARDELELRVAERTAELTRSNALLREKDQHLTLAQRAGHAGLWSRDLTAGTSSMSPEWHELIGFPVDETPVSFAEFLDRVHPDDRERVEDLSLHQKIGDFDREFRIVHPIKGERWILSRGRRGISAEDGHLHMMGALIDITERKHAEQALRRSEERLQHALTVGRMGTWERDLRTGETKWDLRMYDAFEVALGTPVTLDAVYARIHPDDLSGIKAAIANTERLGVEYAQDFRVIRTDGQIHWYHVSGGLRYDRNGNATHIAGINFDITERKQAEEALRQSEERLQHALTVGSMGIWERNLRTGEEKWDRRTYEIFGIEAERSIDLETFFSRIHPEDLPAVKKAVLLTERTGAAYQCDYRVLKPDGNMAWIHANGGLRRDRGGTPAHLAGINFDITERRQAEEALRDSEARLRAILDHNPAPVFIKDTEGKYVHVNSRFEELFGLHGATSVGKTDADLFASEQAQAFQTNDRKVLDLGHAIQFEEVAQYFDGEHTSIVNKFPLRDGQGKIYALCGIATDITERKAAEEALRNLNEQLDQRVAQRTRELAESQARLRALVAELTKAEERERRRIAVELHDYLAQSLTATRMNLSRAEKFVSGSIGNNDLKEILYDVQSDLSNSINYTRTLIGELSPRVLYDLGLPAALGWLGEQMGRHGLSVEVDGPGDDFSLAENDAVFLFQCARELLWNVVKHGDTNRATVAYGRDGNRVSLAVVDNGQGFDPQAVDESGDGGTHLGLFSIRERVELRGGQVEIDSAPGVGAWVSIILPVDHNQEVSAKMVKPDTQLSAFGDAIKIVIVDDHKMVRQGLRRVLEEHDDFTIVGEAGDGAEAVAMARELEPHVVIMDVNLPTMSGIDATQGIMRERPSTIVIGLSFGSDSYVSQAMQAAGAVSCIAKERAVEDVRQAILDAVEGRRVGTAR